MLKLFRKRTPSRNSETTAPTLTPGEMALAESSRTLLAAGEAEGRWLDASMEAEIAREAGEPPARVRALETIAEGLRAKYEEATAAEDRALEAALPYM